MALDTIELDNLVAGDDVVTDLIASEHYQVVKHAFGAAGTADMVTSTATNPFPVALSDTDNAVLDDIAAQNTTVAGAVAAGQMQVDIVADGAGLLTTTAHDAAFGTAGSADAQVRTVQGVASMTPLLTDGSATTQPVSGTVTADLGANNDVTCTLDAETTKVIGTVNVSASQTVGLDAGSASIGTLGANSGVDIGDVDVTSIAAGSNLIGDVGIGVRTTGGATFYLNQDTSAVASVKASAGTLYSIACFNTHTAAVYLNLYNVASGSVTLGTTTPDMQFVVPSQGDANGAGFTINFAPGVAFGTAITVACATTFDGSADPGANLVLTNITYA